MNRRSISFFLSVFLFSFSLSLSLSLSLLRRSNSSFRKEASVHSEVSSPFEILKKSTLSTEGNSNYPITFRIRYNFARFGGAQRFERNSLSSSLFGSERLASVSSVFTANLHVAKYVRGGGEAEGRLRFDVRDASTGRIGALSSPDEQPDDESHPRHSRDRSALCYVVSVPITVRRAFRPKEFRRPLSLPLCSFSFPVSKSNLTDFPTFLSLANVVFARAIRREEPIEEPFLAPLWRNTRLIRPISYFRRVFSNFLAKEPWGQETRCPSTKWKQRQEGQVCS